MSCRILLSCKLRLAFLAVAATLFICLMFPVVSVTAAPIPTVNDMSQNVSTGVITSALSHINGVLGVLSASVQATTLNESNAALKTAIGGVNVTVPQNADSGVTFSAPNSPALNIQLPNAKHARSAARIASGVVAYSGDNGSANAVQTTSDGGVRMLSVIDSPTAPMAYDYKVTIPGGGHIEVLSNGGAVILEHTNQPVAIVNIPWATDAAGKPIKTYFTTDGQTLTQHIEHNVLGVVYPVTADPQLVWKWYGLEIDFNRAQTNDIMLGLASTALAGQFIPNPYSKVVTTALGGYAALAGWAYNKGACIRITVSWSLVSWAGDYYGGYCR